MGPRAEREARQEPRGGAGAERSPVSVGTQAQPRGASRGADCGGGRARLGRDREVRRAPRPGSGSGFRGNRAAERGLEPAGSEGAAVNSCAGGAGAGGSARARLARSGERV